MNNYLLSIIFIKLILSVTAAEATPSGTKGFLDIDSVVGSLHPGALELDQSLIATQGCLMDSSSSAPQLKLPQLTPERYLENKDQANIEVFFDVSLYGTAHNGKMGFTGKVAPMINVTSFLNDATSFFRVSADKYLEKSDAEILAHLNTWTLGLPVSVEERNNLVRNSMIILRMGQFENAQDALNYAGQRLLGATKAQKVSFMSTYLTSLLGIYEYGQLPDGPTEGEARTDNEVHQTLAQNLKSGLPLESGVCRHHHQLAARLARKIGFNDAFGVGYRTVGSGHRTLIFSDPENKTDTIQINYGQVSISKGVMGPSAISQNGSVPDTGIRFRMNDERDRVSIILPSDLGGVLNRVTGGSDSDLGHRYRDESQLMQAGAKTKAGTFRVFHATTPLGNGSQVSGVSYDNKLKLSDNVHLESGLSAYSTTRGVSEGVLDSKGVYSRLGIDAHTNLIDTPSLKLRLGGKVFTRQTVYGSSIDYNPGVKGLFMDGRQSNGDFNIDSQVSLKADYSTGQALHSTELRGRGFTSWANGTNNQGIKLYIPETSIDHSSVVQLDGARSLSLGGGVTMYDVGSDRYFTYTSGVGLLDKSLGVKMDVASRGRINGRMPAWLPGVERDLTFSLTKGLFDNKMYLGVDGRQSFDLQDNRYIGVRFGGRYGGAR